MKAAVFHAQEDLRIEDVPEPSPLPGQVKLRNAFAGICGSDLHVFYSPKNSGLDFDRPHPLTGSTLPQVLGHEFSGTVEEIGEGVDGVEIGDRVAVWPVYYCGECAPCRKGAVNACVKIGFHGLTADGGGMAEFTTVPATMLHKLPENVDLKMGALVEPMAVAWHAVERSTVKPGQTALIAGAGPIGIGVYFALKGHGIDRIIMSEPSESRRAALSALGAEFVIDPVNEDLKARVSAITDGAGVDVAFDAAGAARALTSAIENLTPLGRLVIVALHERTMDFLPTSLVMAETEVAGTLGYLPADFDAVINAMSKGVYNFSGWVAEIGLDAVTDAFAELRAGRGMKVLVTSAS